jgi:hypothetical protein
VDCQTIQIARCLLARIGAVTRLCIDRLLRIALSYGESRFGWKVADAYYALRGARRTAYLV